MPSPHSPRHVLITGGSSGLGLALAERLLRRGDHVTLVARDAAKLASAAKTLAAGAAGAQVHTLALDVSAPASVDALAEALAKSGGLDLLINSAGVLREAAFAGMAADEFRQVMEINFFGTVNAVRAALPFLKRSKRGHIVNVASVAALTGVYGYSAYCSSKYAVLGFSDSLRAELAPEGVRVQVVCPPEFDSPMVAGIAAGRSPENQAHVQTIPTLSVDTVVEATLAGMAGKRFVIVPGAPTKAVTFAIRHFPRLTRWVGDQRIRAARRRRS